MAAAAYADAAAYRAWIAPGTTTLADDEIVRQLTRASELLDDKVTAPFDVDTGTELPADADIAAALSDAACAQVEYWAETGECGDIDGLAGSEVRVGSFAGKRGPELAPRAHRILHGAGLFSATNLADPAGSFFYRDAG